MTRAPKTLRPSLPASRLVAQVAQSRAPVTYGSDTGTFGRNIDQAEAAIRNGNKAVCKRSTQPPRVYAACGFTLLELMIVTAIAVVLLAIAIPSFRTVIRTNRLAATTNELTAALQYARSEAITRGQRVTVCKSSSVSSTTPTCDNSAGWQNGWLIFVDTDQDGTLDTGEVLLKVGQPSTGDTSIASTGFSNYASFLPSGISRNSSGLATGTFSICIAPDKRDIVLNAVGRLRIDTGTCP
jgi:type IV fimbrial biogenesis protein FimT